MNVFVEALGERVDAVGFCGGGRGREERRWVVRSVRSSCWELLGDLGKRWVKRGEREDGRMGW
jgi:hypothetical protein